MPEAEETPQEEAAATVPQGAPQILPQPLPEMWAVEPYQFPNGVPGMVIIIQGLNGTSFHFLERDGAKRIVKQMNEVIGKGPTIITPPGAGKLVIAK